MSTPEQNLLNDLIHDPRKLGILVRENMMMKEQVSRLENKNRRLVATMRSKICERKFDDMTTGECLENKACHCEAADLLEGGE